MSGRRHPLLVVTSLAALATAAVAFLPAGCSSGPRVVKVRQPVAQRECVSCHTEYVDLQTFHLDGEETCGTCHVPHGLVGVLKLKASEPQLCVDCHDDVPVPGEGQRAHPGQGALCSACHDPHKGGSASCTSCHAELGHSVAGHETLDAGCLDCHSPHGPAEGAMLATPEPALCTQCHSADSSAMQRAHGEIPLDRARCSECHAAHEQTGLAAGLRATSHPTTLEGRCSACHENGSDKINKDAGELCRSCHADLKGESRSSVHPGVQEGLCLECHSPHAGPSESILRGTPRDVCTTCHEGVGEVPGSHDPVARGDCLACHSGHGSDESPLLLHPPGQELCSQCHAEEVTEFTSRRVLHEPIGSCDACHSGHGTGAANLLRSGVSSLCGACHADTQEEFQTGRMHAPVAAGACTLCHDPHGAAEKALLPTSAGEQCLSCHEGYHPEALGAVVHQPVEWKLCLSCHDPHSSPHESLLEGTPSELCMTCHAETMRTLEAATWKHPPVEQGDCLACHTSHGGQFEHLMIDEAGRTCLGCHEQVLDDALISDTPHKPVTGARCLDCHQGHHSSFPALTREGLPGLCRQCHVLDGPSFLRSHLDLPGENMECLGCHAAHGGRGKGMLLEAVHSPFGQGDCKSCHEMK